MKISREEHDALVDKVFAYDYYVHIFQKLDLEYIDQKKDQQTAEFWNDFWIYLPDHPAIRREPFFDICDIAERIYDVED